MIPLPGDAPAAPPELMTRAEAAEYLRVSVRTIDRLRAEGALSTVRVAGAVRLRRAELQLIVAGALVAA